MGSFKLFGVCNGFTPRPVLLVGTNWDTKFWVVSGPHTSPPCSHISPPHTILTSASSLTITSRLPEPSQVQNKRPMKAKTWWKKLSLGCLECCSPGPWACWFLRSSNIPTDSSQNALNVLDTHWYSFGLRTAFVFISITILNRLWLKFASWTSFYRIVQTAAVFRWNFVPPIAWRVTEVRQLGSSQGPSLSCVPMEDAARARSGTSIRDYMSDRAR